MNKQEELEMLCSLDNRAKFPRITYGGDEYIILNTFEPGRSGCELAAEAIKTTDPLRYFERGDFHELKPHKRGYTIVFKHYSGLDTFSIKEIIKWNFENDPVGYVPLFDVV